MHQIRILLKDSKGQDIAELALILPLVLVLIGGVVDGGLALFSGHMTQNAVREGARMAATIPPPGPVVEAGTFPSCRTSGSDAMQTVCSAIPNMGLIENYAVNITAVTGAVPNQSVTVTMTGQYSWYLLKFLSFMGNSFPDSIAIGRSATLRWEWQPIPPPAG